MVKLLEVVRSDQTSQATHDQLMTFGTSLGKLCVVCKDTAGFIHNRLLIPASAEAIRMVAGGVASARDIDLAMKLGAGYPVGPLEMADRVGLDTVLHILNGWRERFPDDPIYDPIPLLVQMVKEGRLGVKSGEGFYSYKK
jgi:3-hydroxyacyl-CoA dehydrogenase